MRLKNDAIVGVLLKNDQPVCFTSHRLNNTEKNYAQIEKECLTIVSCMDKWHQYLHGKHDITVDTDHQPLETVFKRPLCKAPRRLQRMMLKLQRHQFQFATRKERNFTLPTLCLGHLSLITLQQPMLSKSTKCSRWK